jgi:hypothetical protein
MEGCGAGLTPRKGLVSQGTMGSGMPEFLPGFRDSPGSRHLSEYTWVSVCGVCECGLGFVSNWSDGGH